MQEFFVAVPDAAEHLQFLMSPGLHLVGAAPYHQGHYIFGFELLAGGEHGLQGRYKLFFSLYSGFGVQTVVAFAAVLFRVLFSEIMQQHTAAAYGCLGVGCGLLKKLFADFLFAGRFALHQFLHLL